MTQIMTPQDLSQDITYDRLIGVDIPLYWVGNGYYITYLDFWTKRLDKFADLLGRLGIEVIELQDNPYLFNKWRHYLNDKGTYYAFNYSEFKEKLKRY